MRTAVRSFTTTGISLVTASALAVAPLIAPPVTTQIHRAEAEISRTALHLVDSTSPLAAYGDLFNDIVQDVQGIEANIKTNGLTPILTATLKNQITSLQDIIALLTPGSTLVNGPGAGQPSVGFVPSPSLLSALGSTLGQIGNSLFTTVPPLLESSLSNLLQGNVEGAINQFLLATVTAVFPVTNLLTPAINAVAYPLQAVVTALSHLGPLGTILGNPLQNVVNVLNTLNQGFDGFPPTNITTIVGGLLGPIISVPAAFGTAVQNVINAVRTGNLGKTVAEIISIPATMLDGLLHGGYGPDLSGLINTGLPGIAVLAGGLLNQFTLSLGATIKAILPGVAGVFQLFQSLVAGALKAPAVTKSSSSPLAAAAAVPSTTAATIALPTTKAATTDPMQKTHPRAAVGTAVDTPKDAAGESTSPADAGRQSSGNATDGTSPEPSTPSNADNTTTKKSHGKGTGTGSAGTSAKDGGRAAHHGSHSGTGSHSK